MAGGVKPTSRTVSRQSDFLLKAVGLTRIVSASWGQCRGYTTLASLAFRPGVFAAGMSDYGIGDLEALAAHTHKFESRYLDTVVAPYPEGIETYRARSPLGHADQMTTPLLLLQEKKTASCHRIRPDQWRRNLTAGACPMRWSSLRARVMDFDGGNNRGELPDEAELSWSSVGICPGWH